jgi:hypothetical protein
MTPSGFKTKMKAGEIEAAIMKRLAEKPDCGGIIQVCVKSTGRQPPEDTWAHTLIARRPNFPRTAKEMNAMHDVLNEVRKKFDLIPD